MKHPLIAGLVGGALLLSGCQSLSWTAKNKSPSQNSVAQAENVREVPWTWRKKKSPDAKTELPPELAQKFEDAKRRNAAPKTAEEWIAEGSQQEIDRNFAAAKKAYDEALRIDPVNPAAHHRLGILADMRQDFVVAQDHYEAALRQKPHDANLLSDLGYSHHLQGNVQQSKRYLLQALDVDRQHKQALKNLGTLYASQGWYEEAALAFRHYRSETEAQKLLSQYFPQGKPIPGDEIALAGGQRTAPPMPPEKDVDPESLKGMTQDEIMQLMNRQKQIALREREQKLMAEMRPPLDPATGQNPFASSQPPQKQPATNNQPWPGEASPNTAPASPWDQNSTVAHTNRAQPPNGDPFANRSGLTSNANPPPENPSRAPSQDMPFWEGKGAQQPTVAQTPPPNWPAGNGLNSNPAPTQIPSWADGNSQTPYGNAGQNLAQPGPERLPSGLSGNDFARRDNSQPGAPAAPPRNNYSQSVSRQAYQLGMSAGPGTMFPNVTGNAAAAMPAPNSGSTNEQWSNSTAPGGYTEMKPSAGWGQPENSPQDSQWQTAPTQITPQSPSENWNSPTSVPWPGNASTQPAAGNTTVSRSSGQPMPVITPGMSPWGNATAASPRNNDSSVRSASGTDRNAETGSGVVPAWYDARPTDAPAPTSRRGTATNPTTVPQWPYAPK